MSDEQLEQIIQEIETITESNSAALSASIAAISSIQTSFQITREALDKDLDELEKSVG
jgi:prefoldin subunit 5